MLRAAALGVFTCGLLAAAGAHAAAGLLIQGVGSGQSSGSQGFGGPYVCEDVPFEVTTIFLPGNTGIARYSWASAAASGENCFLVSNGGTNSVGVVEYDLSSMPPLEYQAACVGNEAQGLACGGFLFIGPYAGPGSSMWMRDTMPGHAFEGLFIAT